MFIPTQKSAVAAYFDRRTNTLRRTRRQVRVNAVSQHVIKPAHPSPANDTLIHAHDQAA